VSAKPSLLWARRISPRRTTVHAFAEGAQKSLCGLIAIDSGDRWRLTYEVNQVTCTLCAASAHKLGHEVASFNLPHGRRRH
jgi:hypothetical protein